MPLNEDKMTAPEMAVEPRQYIVDYGFADDLKSEVKPIGTEQIQEMTTVLQEYKRGKANLEHKIIENEQFWKLRHWSQMRQKGYTPATAWLWNVIVRKHADLEEGYPEPNVLPRESGDKEEAEILSDIIPVIMEQNNFHKTYSDACWYKLKQGCAIYGIFWNPSKNNIGDIEVKMVDALNLFWEPAVKDIQSSRYVFHTELVDNETLEAQYPQLAGKLSAGDHFQAKYLYDETVDTTKKSTVVSAYYKKNVGGKTILHYVKFCGDEVLYATENETTPAYAPMMDDIGNQVFNPQTGDALNKAVAEPLAQAGLYEHGKYPFVFDCFYPAETGNGVFGYGLTDVSKDTQITIDQLNSAIVKNSMMASKRRYFANDSLDINLEDFANWEKDIVPVSSMMNDETIREITVNPLSGIYVEILNNQINMLKETTGNTDVRNGGTPSGVTSASGIVALQEQAGLSSKDCLATTYNSYKEIVYFVIELIRQFYDTPRQFRIIGNDKAMRFVSYDNSGIKPQAQGLAEDGTDFGVDMGYRIPVFDIDVTPQRATAYNKMSQNELALQFYNLQFFNPQNTTQALACIEMMDFDSKQEVIDMIQRNGTMLEMFQQVFGIAMGMAQAYDPTVIPNLMQIGVGAGIVDPMMASQQTMRANAMSQDAKAIDSGLLNTDENGNVKGEEHPFVKNARERVQNASQVNG